MMRQRVWFRLAAGLLLWALPAFAAAAAELPTRKAGLWEVKMLRTGSPLPDMTTQHCTDEATDKQMTATFSPASKEICAKSELQQTATGYSKDDVCTIRADSA